MGAEATSLATLMDNLFENSLGKAGRAQSRAARAWYVANGDRERLHTTGVWTRQGAFKGADPVLCVAVDSGLLAQELSCNKDIYLQRLAFAGVAISDIRFSVLARSDTRKEASRKRKEDQTPLPPLSDFELRQVEEATKNLPDGLRQTASKAMCASLRRNKSKTSRKP